jgi:hypothetical protein
MVANVLVIAGLPRIFFDKIKTVSASRITPAGKIIMSPLTAGTSYGRSYVDSLLDQVYTFCLAQKEEVQVSIQLLYADYGDHGTASLLSSFFPFALPCALILPSLDGLGRREINSRLNDIEEQVVRCGRRLKDVSIKLTHHTNLPNLNPILLPRRNFQGKELDQMLAAVFKEATAVSDIDTLLKDQVATFIKSHPRVTPPDDRRSALSDGNLYFKSPGKDRHGYFRHAIAHEHEIQCLLNAKCRVGGAYDYRLHYDCMPVRGKLHKSYDSCHGQHGEPKTDHVNIAPNDYVI